MENEMTAEDYLAEAMDSSIWPEQVKNLKKSIELDPDNIDPYIFWGVELYNKAQAGNDLLLFEEAAEKFKKVIEIDPHEYHSYVYQGACLASLARPRHDLSLYSRAMELYRSAILRDPGEAFAYACLSDSLIQVAKITKEKSLLLEAIDNLLIAETITEGIGMFNLACAYSVLGDIPNALSYFEKALQVDEDIREKIEADTDFDNIRVLPEFKLLLDQYKPLS